MKEIGKLWAHLSDEEKNVYASIANKGKLNLNWRQAKIFKVTPYYFKTKRIKLDK